MEEQDIEAEIVQIGQLNIHGCIGYGYIRVSPTYYGGIAGSMKAFLDRIFFTSSDYFKYKVATSISVVRRSGGVGVVHQLNNYLDLAQTVTTPSQYWTVAYSMEAL